MKGSLINKLKKDKVKRNHPLVTYLRLILIVFVLSFILSLFNMSASYNTVNGATVAVNPESTSIVNLFSPEVLKQFISGATTNFMSFAPLSMFLMSTIGISICEASGFLDSVYNRLFAKLNSKFITFLVVFIATISTIINEVGFVLIIPLAAILFRSKKRNPLLGIIAAFAGCAFGTGTTIFCGSLEVNMIPYTTSAARLIDESQHIALTSNLFIMIATSIILSVVGTVVVEKIIAPRLAKYHKKQQEVEVIENIDEEPEVIEQIKLSDEYHEKKGFKWATIVTIVFALLFIYGLIDGLPYSGLLLDKTQKTYVAKVFGNNSYFLSGFNFIVTMYLIIAGLTYGLVSKRFVGSYDVAETCEDSMKHMGTIVLLIFVVSILNTAIKMSNLGTIVCGILANFLNSLTFGGIIFMIVGFIFIALSNVLLPGTVAKWSIFAPTLVTTLMKSNISPQFSQFVMRAADSVTNGINPLFPYFVFFIGYLNFYNPNKDKTITIKESIRLIMPYFVIISITWLGILLGWYVLGIPIGPGTYVTF